MYAIICIIMVFSIYKIHQYKSSINCLNKVLDKLNFEIDALKDRVQALEKLEELSINSKFRENSEKSISQIKDLNVKLPESNISQTKTDDPVNSNPTDLNTYQNSNNNSNLNNYSNSYSVVQKQLSYRHPLAYLRLFSRYLDTFDVIQVNKSNQPEQHQNHKNIRHLIQESKQIFQELKSSYFVKVGMLILIVAVIAFLSYTTMRWFNVSIHIKSLGLALIALGILAFSWTKRQSKRNFSLVMQGVSISVVLLTIFASVKIYGILSPLIGFVISLLMILLNVVLAVQQNTKILAIMAIFSGFLAPIWLFDGLENHILLFSYYAILNIGIFIITILRPWMELNVLGFIFTYIIGYAIGLHYNSNHFATTEPFVILFFFFYLLIPLRYAQQVDKLPCHEEQGLYQKYKLNSVLLFGTPLVTLIAQVSLLDDNAYIAISCVAMGVIYGLLASILRSYKDKESMINTLQKTCIWLSVSFFTLAVLFGLSAKAITTVFALEGFGAVWLGARANVQKRQTLTWLAGGFLQVFSSIAFFMAYFNDEYGLYSTQTAVINERYISGILLSISLFLCTWCSYHAVRVSNSVKSKTCLTEDLLLDNKRILSNQFLIKGSRFFFLFGISWWLGINLFEIVVMGYDSINIMYRSLIFMILTANILPFFYNHKFGYKDDVVWMMTLLLIMTGVLPALSQWNSIVMLDKHISLGLASTAWSLFAIGGWFVWRAYKGINNWFTEFSIAVWFLVLASTISTLTYQVLLDIGTFEKSGWCWGALVLVWIVIVAIDIYKPSLFMFIGQRPTTDSQSINLWQSIVSWVSVSILGCVFIILTFNEGSHGNWLPITNSVDSLQILLLVLIVMWTIRHQIVMRPIIAYLLVAPLVMSITYRMIDHWTLSFLEMSDWNWLVIFEFWVILALICYLVLNDKLLSFIFQKSSHLLELVQILLNSVMFLLGIIWFVLLFNSGQLQTWIPLLNPIEFLQCSILVMLWLWCSGNSYQIELLNRDKRLTILAGLVIILITTMSLRLVYHLSDDYLEMVYIH